MSTSHAGAILAPYYLEGESDPKDWAKILQYPAPWGEIGSSKLAIAAPATSLRMVQDPAAVAAYWDRVQDRNAWLAGIPPERPAPMRFQHDADIAGGYMHRWAQAPLLTGFLQLPCTPPALPSRECLLPPFLPGLHYACVDGTMYYLASNRSLILNLTPR
jgi:hypothetical protein